MDLIVDIHNAIAKELRDNNTGTEKIVLSYDAYMKLRREPGQVILHATGKEEFHGITIECDPKQTEDFELISRQ
ncbi:hypothetical protein G9G53_22600 [Paenibacillus sp. EKM206P]|uniref:hypothetical protein n=1 Tax=Paenibacillus sp. EKM206P TaxID=1683674 RepID=UPI0013EBFEE3|nr:hypothetical protein [Paenibacillus sp. EKM206P]KAF6569082.1 hypothetical protein G9G53_22600 [Paenibacillus sp. EKM206P]